MYWSLCVDLDEIQISLQPAGIDNERRYSGDRVGHGVDSRHVEKRVPALDWTSSAENDHSRCSENTAARCLSGAGKRYERKVERTQIQRRQISDLYPARCFIHCKRGIVRYSGWNNRGVAWSGFDSSRQVAAVFQVRVD